jgi:hypothetical protein
MPSQRMEPPPLSGQRVLGRLELLQQAGHAGGGRRLHLGEVALGLLQLPLQDGHRLAKLRTYTHTHIHTAVTICRCSLPLDNPGGPPTSLTSCSAELSCTRSRRTSMSPSRSTCSMSL